MVSFNALICELLVSLVPLCITIDAFKGIPRMLNYFDV